MKLLSIIGTRPQYVKIKPFFDFCKNNQIDHIIVDTLQHYSPNVSDIFIKEFNLDIKYSIKIANKNELNFMSESIIKISDILSDEKPDIVLVYGDTNSTFCAALVAYKMGFPIAHVEAGVRGFYKIPEEINRTFVDSISDIKFCSSEKSLSNLNDGILTGDLEYELLYNLDPKIEFKDFGIMTIHRQNNVNKKRLEKIFNFCKKINKRIDFFVHHRTNNLLNSENIAVPDNINILEPCSYSDMVRSMAGCSFIITDSGSIQKSSPFFGKKTLIMRDEGFEWIKTEEKGYAKKCNFLNEDIEWILSKEVLPQDKQFYGNSLGVSRTIIESIKKFLREKNEKK